MNAQNGQHNQNRGGGLSWSQPARPAGESSSKPAPQPAQKNPSAPISFASPNGGGASKRTLGLALAAGLVFGFLLGWLWFGNEDGGLSTGSTATSTQENAGTSSQQEQGGGAASSGSSDSRGRDSFVVSPTQPAGMSVAISDISVSGNTWIVVYESANGRRGNALGAGLFNSDSSAGVVRLLRATVAGKTYFVGHHRDDGDRKFSLEKDRPVLGADGEPLYVEFRAQ